MSGEATYNPGDLDLTLFDGAAGAAGAAGAGEGAAAGQPGGQPGPQEAAILEKIAQKQAARAARTPGAGGAPTSTQAPGTDQGAGDKAPAAEGDKAPAEADGRQQAERRQAFEDLIKGEYADIFQDRVQKILADRFKTVKGLEERVETLSPVVQLMAQKYGVDAQDTKALAKAVEEDDSFWEAEAVDRGMTVKDLREMKRMERENEQLRRAVEEQRRVEQADRTYAQWMRDAGELKKAYPKFDLETECSDPKTGKAFVSMLRSGIPMQNAYESLHIREIMTGTAEYVAQRVQQGTMENIRSRGMRPEENGTGGQAGADVVLDPRKLTRAQRDELNARAARGERITL